MEPIFINRTTVDKRLMEEWFKQDIKRNHKIFTIGHIAMAAAVAVMAASLFYMGIKINTFAMIVLGFVVVLLDVMLLLNMLLQPKIQVWLATRRDKEHQLSKPYMLMFYPTYVVMIKDLDNLGGEDRVKQFQNCYQQAEGLQNEFLQIAEDIKTINPHEEAGLLSTKNKLEDLQARMDNFNKEMAGMGRPVNYEYEKITNYFETEKLYIIYFDGHAMLVDKNGFEKGTQEEFVKYTFMFTAMAASNAKKQEEENQRTSKKGKNNESV